MRSFDDTNHCRYPTICQIHAPSVFPGPANQTNKWCAYTISNPIALAQICLRSIDRMTNLLHSTALFWHSHRRHRIVAQCHDILPIVYRAHSDCLRAAGMVNQNEMAQVVCDQNLLVRLSMDWHCWRLVSIVFRSVKHSQSDDTRSMNVRMIDRSMHYMESGYFVCY